MCIRDRRYTDYASDEWLPVTQAWDDEFTVDVHVAPVIEYTPTNATYDPTTGLMVLTIGDHDLSVDAKVMIKEGGITFECTQNAGQAHAYPRPTIDTHTAGAGTSYAPDTGLMVIDTGTTHGIKVGDWVMFDDGAVTFTCTQGGGNHSYPRSTDPVSGKWIEVTAVTSQTFTVQVLTTIPSTNVTTHTFVSGTTDGIKQKRDKAFEQHVPVTAVGTTTITVDVGISSNTTTHTFMSALTGAVQFNPLYQHTFVSCVADGIKKQDGTVTVNVGTTGTVAYTPSAATYDPVTGDLKLNVGLHNLTEGTTIKLADDSLTFTCNMDNNATTHTYPRATDPVANTAIPIKEVGASKWTPTSASYNPGTGDLAITIPGHGFSNGNRVRISDGSLVFTCAADLHATRHAYPRPTDPFSDEWLVVSNVSTNQFQVNIGPSPNTSTHTFVSAATNGLEKQDGNITINVGRTEHVDYDVSYADYNHNDGTMVLNIGNHGLRQGTSIKLAANSLGFKCAKDAYTSTHYYPRAKAGDGAPDPFFDKAITVASVGSENFTATNAAYTPTTGEMTLTVAGHGFKPSTQHTVTSASYNAVTGIMKMTLANHGLQPGQQMRFEPNSLTFTCDKDGNATKHTYPRPTDPVANKWLTITSTTTNTFEVVIGESPKVQYDVAHADYDATTGEMVITTVGPHHLRGHSDHTVTDATYNPSSGVMKLTIVDHGFANGDKVKIADNSLVFTCAQDSDQTEHTYPRTTDPASGTWMEISNVSTDSFEVQILRGTSPTNTTAHTFVRAHTDGVRRVGETVMLASNSLQFKCAMDDYATTHTYPRTSTISHTATDADYDPNTGVMTVTVGSHGMDEGDWIKFGANSLTFTCTQGGGNHSYPRTTDPAYDTYLPIFNVTANTFDVQVLTDIPSTNTTTHTFVSATTDGITQKIDRAYGQPMDIIHSTAKTITVNVGKTPLSYYTASNASYDEVTGVMVLTIGSHKIKQNDGIRLAPNSLTFRCNKDGYGTDNSYPRTTDPFYNTTINVDAVTATQITINVGVDSDPANQYPHQFQSALANGVIAGGAYDHDFVNALTGETTYSVSDASYTPASGVMVITSAKHGFVNGDKVKFVQDSLTFRCEMDDLSLIHI